MGRTCYVFLSKPNGKPFVLKLANAEVKDTPTGYEVKAGKPIKDGGEPKCLSL
jgi:hypothetical protein